MVPMAAPVLRVTTVELVAEARRAKPVEMARRVEMETRVLRGLLVARAPQAERV